MTPAGTEKQVAFRLEAPAAAEDDVVAALWECGTAGVHVQPAGPGRIALVAYFPARPDLLTDLRATLGPAALAHLQETAIPDVDWVARFREGFRAFDAGPFRIVPAWEAEAAVVPGPGGRTLRILPARAFGTGTHESTRLCLAALASLAGRKPLGRVVDLGAGTGILAVAAALLGAWSVTAIDTDADAVESARLHARLNRVDLHVVRGDGGRPLKGGRSDVVLANLTAPLLLEKRDEIAALRAPSGALVLAGFLRDDADGMARAYAGIGDAAMTTDGDWAALAIEARP